MGMIDYLRAMQTGEAISQGRLKNRQDAFAALGQGLEALAKYGIAQPRYAEQARQDDVNRLKAQQAFTAGEGKLQREHGMEVVNRQMSAADAQRQRENLLSYITAMGGDMKAGMALKDFIDRGGPAIVTTTQESMTSPDKAAGWAGAFGVPTEKVSGLPSFQPSAQPTVTTEVYPPNLPGFGASAKDVLSTRRMITSMDLQIAKLRGSDPEAAAILQEKRDELAATVSGAEETPKPGAIPLEQQPGIHEIRADSTKALRNGSVAFYNEGPRATGRARFAKPIEAGTWMDAIPEPLQDLYGDIGHGVMVEGDDVTAAVTDSADKLAELSKSAAPAIRQWYENNIPEVTFADLDVGFWGPNGARQTPRNLSMAVRAEAAKRAKLIDDLTAYSLSPRAVAAFARGIGAK